MDAAVQIVNEAFVVDEDVMRKGTMKMNGNKMQMVMPMEKRMMGGRVKREASVRRRGRADLGDEGREVWFEAGLNWKNLKCPCSCSDEFLSSYSVVAADCGTDGV